MKAGTIISHIAALAAGLALAAMMARKDADDGAGSGGSTAIANPSPARASERGRGEAAGGTRAEEYQRAWDDLAQQKMSAGQRHDIQWRLLKAWAMVDLEAALRAAMAEAPGTGRGAFDEAFMAQPLESWKILSKFGLGSMQNIIRWTQVVAMKDPDAVISVLGEMPPSLKPYAASYLFDDIDTDEQADELKKKLVRAGSPEELENFLTSAWQAAGYWVRKPPLPVESWLDLPAGSVRLNAMMGWASSIRMNDVATLEANWAKVPTADRELAARILLGQLSYQSPNLTFAIDRAIETGQWEALRESGSGAAYRYYLMKGDPEKIAAWALTLPQREEVGAFFGDAITPKLNADPEAGREWLEAMPEGSWQRDEGFAALARAALKDKGDLEAADRAIESITDPAIRRKAEEARYDWALEKGERELIRPE